MLSIEVHALPSHALPAQLAGATVVVADVLRATTSMIWALAAGATDIIPAATVEEARRVAAERPDRLLAGERNCLPIDGFDFGNSPRAFRSGTTAERTLVMTTTNGTAALLHCQRADRVLVGAFANLTAIAQSLADRSFHVLCAGTDGHPTEEDLLFAGAIVDLVTQPSASQRSIRLLSAAEACLERWRRLDDHRGALESALRESRGGRNLVAIGRQDDIADAAQLDCCPLVVEYFADDGSVRRAADESGRPMT